MSSCLEARVPFLDQHIANFAFDLGQDEHFEDGLSKAPLRSIGRGFLPDTIVNRKDKTGFETPQLEWQFDGLLAEYIGSKLEQVISEKNISFLNYRELERLYWDHKKNQKDPYFWWRLFCLHEFIKIWDLNVTEIDA